MGTSDDKVSSGAGACQALLDSALRLHESGCLYEAEASYRQVLAREPRNAQALHLLGMVQYQQGRIDESVSLIQESIRLAPTVAHYHSNLAGIFGRLRRMRDVLYHAQEAIRLGPTLPEGHHNLAVALESLGRFEDAVESYRRAIELRPSYAEAHHHLGNTLRKLGRLEEAVASHQQAIRLRPAFAKAHGGKAGTLAEQGELDGALAAMRDELAASPNPASHSALLYTLHYSPLYGRSELFQEHRQWDRVYGEPNRKDIIPHENDRNPNRRLRVGYVSPDFREHTVPRFISPALEHHDHEAFEVSCYDDARRHDTTTERLRRCADAWRHTEGLSDEDLARLIRGDRIDILVDLRGHGGGNRLPVFARKPAPVQVTMVGYFDTTGLSAMDWRITDHVQDPAGESNAFHTERLARLPGGCWCYRPDDQAPDVGPLPADRNGYVTFGSLNKLVKVNAELGRLWGRILEAVPNSRLLLPVTGEDIDGSVRRRLVGWGIPIAQVRIVRKTRTRAEYLSRFNEVDLVVDTHPFSGITTTCDGLWMGAPAVTLSGKTSVSRSGASILSSLGLPELIARDPEHYVRLAIDLSHDRQRLRQLRAEMRQQVRASPLGNAQRFAGELESRFRWMWERWRDQT